MLIRRLADPAFLLLIMCIAAGAQDVRAASAIAQQGEIARPAPHAGELNLGTGTIVSLNGDIITNAHVVSGCAKLAIVDANSDEHAAQVVLNDAHGRDLALIRTTGLTAADDTLPGHFALPPSGVALHPGDAVRIAGYSYEQGKPFKLTFSSGSVVVPTEQTSFSFAFAAALTPGNSGGPVIDSRGRLSGLVVGRIIGARDIGVGFSADELADFLSAGNINFERNSWVRPLPPATVERIAQRATVGIQCTY